MMNDMAKGNDMKGTSNKRLVPEFRFPEFKQNGEWEEKILGDLCKIGNGKDYKHLNKGRIPVYGSGGYMTSIDAFLYDGDSVCIGRKGTIDRPIFLTGKFWTVDTLFYTHSFCCCLPKFLYWVFQQIDWYRYNEAGGVPSLSTKTIENIKHFFPSLAEQQKIAECLSSIDEEINAIKEKAEQLKIHKKGLMQKLFPVAGKFVPELRFPEFEKDEEWECKRLEDLCKIGNGKDYKHLNKGCIPVYGSGGYMTSVDSFLYDGDSVCIGRKGTIDKPIFLTGKFWTVDTLFYTHSFCCCLPKFLYYFFQQIDWYIYNEAGGVPSLSKKTIENIRLPFPSYAEQQEIAECLSSIDELISLYENKVTLLELHKKGLMQRLFPKQID